MVDANGGIKAYRKIWCQQVTRYDRHCSDDKLAIARDGVLYRDNPYGYDPTPMHHKFHQDGQNNRLLASHIAIDCPIYLFHGQNDEDVPFDISIQLMKALRSSQVHLTLIKDGDHRFSRDQDISLLLRAIDDIWKLRNTASFNRASSST